MNIHMCIYIYIEREGEMYVYIYLGPYCFRRPVTFYMQAHGRPPAQTACGCSGGRGASPPSTRRTRRAGATRGLP